MENILKIILLYKIWFVINIFLHYTKWIETFQLLILINLQISITYKVNVLFSYQVTIVLNK